MIPWLAYTEQMLSKLPEANDGDVIACTVCHQNHTLTSMPHPITGVPTDTLYYECQGTPCLGAVKGRLVVDITPYASSREKQ